MSTVVVSVFLVGRAIVEFWAIDFSDPTSYHKDWDGPSLLGVLAVHSGPGLLITIALVAWLIRKNKRHSHSK